MAKPRIRKGARNAKWFECLPANHAKKKNKMHSFALIRVIRGQSQSGEKALAHNL
jgi:hypothetical protein